MYVILRMGLPSTAQFRFSPALTQIHLSNSSVFSTLMSVLCGIQPISSNNNFTAFPCFYYRPVNLQPGIQQLPSGFHYKCVLFQDLGDVSKIWSLTINNAPHRWQAGVSQKKTPELIPFNPYNSKCVSKLLFYQIKWCKTV